MFSTFNGYYLKVSVGLDEKMKALFIITIACLVYLEAVLLTDQCTSKVYCQSDLLDVIQKARLFNDSKTFVDLTQKNPENQTIANFDALMTSTNNNPTKDDLLAFINENFDSENELVNWTPTDLQTKPAFIDHIVDPAVKAFAIQLNNIWSLLARKVNDSVFENPHQHSLIGIPNGFMIPGGRFKEIYYWDSYWIVKGLLICGMEQSAKGVIENFIYLVKTYGFIPNGSRVYYLNRSQPPLLSHMVELYLNATGDKSFLEENIDILETELKWWLENRLVTISSSTAGKCSTTYTLVQYATKSETPRPESYYEDIVTCSNFTAEQKTECYKNLKSGAESGWDFSTRWFTKDGQIGANLSDIDTTNVVPVDLNAYLCAGFGYLSKFYALLGNSTKATEYAAKEHAWKRAIQKLFYDKNDGIWYDFDLNSGKSRKNFYPSNFAPLWAKSYDTDLREEYGSRAADYFNENSLDIFAGGVPTSLNQSGQQWDLPNAWPPLQEIIILGLHSTGNAKAKKIAESCAKRTVEAFMIGFNNTGEMFEKYDAINAGQYGGGGEYTVQSGFGWSNGVGFSLIKTFYSA